MEMKESLVGHGRSVTASPGGVTHLLTTMECWPQALYCSRPEDKTENRSRGPRFPRRNEKYYLEEPYGFYRQQNNEGIRDRDDFKCGEWRRPL